MSSCSLSVLLALTLILGITACSDKNQDDKKSKKTEQAAKDNDTKTEQTENSDESSGKEILEKTIKELEKVDSAHMISTVTTKYSVLGTDVDMKVNVEGDVDVANGATYMTATTITGDTSMKSDIYIQTKTGSTDIYMSSNGLWIKQTGISESEIFNYF